MELKELLEIQGAFKSELDKWGEKIDQKLLKANEEAKNAASDATKKISEETKSEITSLVEKYNEMQRNYDILDTKIKDVRGISQDSQLNTKALIRQALEQKGDMKDILKKDSKGSLNFSIKAPVLESTDLTGEVIAPTRRAGIVLPPSRALHVRDLMRVSPSGGGKFTYTRETAYTDGTAIIEEGDKYPESRIQLTQASVDPVKIGAYMKLSLEILSDIPGLQAYVSGRMRTKLMYKEDQQVIFGTGLSGEIQGLYTAATAFAAGTRIVASPNMFDVLEVAASKTRINEYVANGAIVSPEDFSVMRTTKNSQGNYLLPELMFSGQRAVSIAGMTIIESTLMTPGSFLVGDFLNAAELLDVWDLAINIAYENEDDFLRDLVTIKISERIMMPIYFPQAFIKGTFTAAISDITS